MPPPPRAVPPRDLPGADENKFAGRAVRKIKASEIPEKLQEIKSLAIPCVDMNGFDETTREVVEKVVTSKSELKSKQLMKDASIAASGGEGESGESLHLEWMRKLAGLTYVTNPGPITVAEIAEMPQFKGKISERSLSHFCGADGWVERRKRYAQQLQAQLEKKIATAQVRSRIEQLEKLDSLYTMLDGSLEGLKPLSLEGVANAMIRLVKTSEELRDKVCASIVAPEAAQKEADPVKTIVTDDEARFIATALIERRRKENRSVAAKDTGDQSDDH
jgi:hypothetical protein